ncbi:MAG: LysM peptidoglycan-binding domain-containing protein [Myxococcota bacterium]
MMRVLVTLALVTLVFGPSSGLAGSEHFPRPAALEPDIEFWTRVYTEVSTDAGFIHDSRDLGVVYEVVHLPKGASSRTRSRITDRAKKRIKGALLSLARGKRSGLSAEERKVLSRFPDGVSNATLKAASRRLRFQLGQADKFKAGLVRSGAWEPHIRETFTEMGLPVELAALPHVESSYTPHAYSRIGAAGLWQFTRSTGRRFMRVDHVVDERLDPYRATLAAARLLEQNRQTTGSWPLAITAYNHGAAGMRRAVRNLGTRDIATIVRKYKSRTFGFASRNFYLEFLAAADVDFHSEKYFGPLLMDAPVEYVTLELPYYTNAGALHRALGVDLATLRSANPALRGPIWEGAKHVPRGYTIRVPRDQIARPVAAAIESIPRTHRFARQVPDTTHRVRRGETVSTIAARYGVRIRDIVALNGLRSQHRIRAGQRLRLPDPRGGRRVAPAPPSTPMSPPASGLYTVRRGDTITRIASRFGLDESELIRSNRLRNRNRIYVGQRLRVGAAPEVAAAAVDPHPETRVALSAPTPPPAPAEPAPAIETPGPELGPELGPAAGSERTRESSSDLMADPSDYSVSRDGSIEVQAAETLGHYADWLELRTHRLRQINGMRYGQDLHLGRPIKLDFSRVTPAEFESRRRAYHQELQAEFFERYEISGTRVHVMRRGDSLWSLSQRRYRIPLWLIRQYNPDLDFGALSAGTKLNIPVVRPHHAPAHESVAPSGTAARAVGRTTRG